MVKLKVFNDINVHHVANNLREVIEEMRPLFGKSTPKENKHILSLLNKIIVLQKLFNERLIRLQLSIAVHFQVL